jgi:sec-independent protein translocase protein TatC
MTQEPKMSLAEHLDELRRRLGMCLMIFLVAVGISWTQVDRIIAWLKHPVEPWLPRLVFVSPTEPMMAYLTVTMLAGFILAMPMMLWQAWGFIRRGLTPRERRLGGIFVWWGSALFLAGAGLAYYGVLPISLKYLLGVGGDTLEPMVSISTYLSFVTTIMFWCGLICELPLVLWVLAAVGVVTSEWLRQQRPYAILVLVIIAAMVTPTTDPVNLLLLLIPMLLLYEVSIVITRVAIRRRA